MPAMYKRAATCLTKTILRNNIDNEERAMIDNGQEFDQMLQAAAKGDAKAWGLLLAAHQERLRRTVHFRLDARVQSRVDASDVVQDALFEAVAHREDYFQKTPMPIFLWLRGIVSNKLLELHRHHLGTQMRDAAREVALDRRSGAEGGTSAALLAQLTGHLTGPGTALAGAEVKVRLQDAMNSMDPIDREVLALRHFEQLTNGEAAQVLGIQERAAVKRYKRLRDVLAEMPGGLTELRS